MTVMVIGGGRVGSHVAGVLHRSGHDVIVVEHRSEQAVRLTQLHPNMPVVHGDGADPYLLERIGIQQVKIVAAVTGNDTTNLTVASLCRFAYAVPRIAARINDPRSAWLFTPEMGVDVALDQAGLIGHLILEAAELGEGMTSRKLCHGRYSLVQGRVDAQSPAVGKPICELELPLECVMAAILHQGKLIPVGNDTVIRADDEILAFVETSAVAQFAAVIVVQKSEEETAESASGQHSGNGPESG